MAGVTRKNVPFAMATGSQYGGATSTVVTFPSGRFTVTPVLVVNNLENVNLTVTAISAASFTYVNAVASNNSLMYVAVQMTSTSATG